MRFAQRWSACLLVLATATTASGDVTPSQRLATEFMRMATIRTMTDPLTVDSLNAAIMLAQEAVQLDPNNADDWRLLLDMAVLAERDDLRQQSVERISQLDPSDESVQLMRLNAAMDRFQTVDERSAAYEKLLSPENVERLGPAVASRLALDYALMHRREGDNDAFSRWLSQALKLDSSNRSAAAIAAGFYRMNVQDALGEAELLTNLMLADPTDIATQVALAQLLLEHGAYVGSDRIYTLAVQSTLAARSSASNNMLADRAVAQWANGNDRGALDTLRKRQSEMDTAFRNDVLIRAQRENRDVNLLDLNQLTAPPDPTLASVAAAIHAEKNDDLAAPAIAAAINAYQVRIDAAKANTDRKMPDSEYARAYLEMAWIDVWLGGDLQQVPQYITNADALEPLTQEAKDRFEGWSAYRRGEASKAVELLSPIAADDVAARLGLALALLELQRKQDAARELLAVNQQQPGTLIGIWAADRLSDLLGQRVALSEQATRLEQLISSIPGSLDRYPRDSSLAIGLRVVPSKITFDPYEPITFNLEITNNSLFPLALDRDGPIRPQVLIAPVVRSANARGIGELRAFVVNVGRRLRLEPRQKMVVPVNLRTYHPGDALNLVAVNGCIIKLNALINFTVTQTANPETGLYGCETEAPLMRLEGETISNEWVEKTTAALQNSSLPDALAEMAVLGHVIAPRPARDATEEDRRLIDAARATFNQIYQTLEPAAQAWLLSVLPHEAGPAGEGLQSVLAMAKKSENRLVQIAYILYQSTGPRDPMFDAALRGGDPVLQALATIVRTDMQEAAKRPERGR